jgi:biotin carboxylase
MQGVFHVELKYTSRGPRLIEVNCRMGGGPVRNTILMVWGVDMVEEHLLTAAGIPSRPNVAPRPLHHIAEYSVNADVTGIIENVDFLQVNCQPTL